MSKKLLVLLLVSLVNIQVVHAGALTKMIEVEPEARQELEANRVKLQQCLDAKAKLSTENSDLKNRIAALMKSVNENKVDTKPYESKIASLTKKNTDLESQLSKLKASLAEKPEPKEVKLVDVDNETPIDNILWPIVATPIGLVTGTVRGAMNKSMQYTNSAADYMGPSLPGRLIGTIGGMLVGNVTGAVTGLIRGIYDGIVTGYKEPLSSESVSMAGDYASDYDPYEVFKN